MKHIATVLTLLALALPASAHEIWITPGPSGGVAVHYGHVHEPEMPSAEKLVSLIAYQASGDTDLTATPDTGERVLKAAIQGDALVAAAYDNGYWVRLADGAYRNASLRMIPDARRSLWSAKFAKLAIGASAPWQRVVGQPLEIVPLEAPASARGKIRVRVLFEGRPLAGGDVSATDGASFKTATDQAHAPTDSDGVAEVPLRMAGPQVLRVSHRVEPSRTPALARSDSFVATFSFDIADPKTN